MSNGKGSGDDVTSFEVGEALRFPPDAKDSGGTVTVVATERLLERTRILALREAYQRKRLRFWPRSEHDIGPARYLYEFGRPELISLERAADFDGYRLRFGTPCQTNFVVVDLSPTDASRLLSQLQDLQVRRYSLRGRKRKP